jgi:colanic acid biosynthesis glycosyl transferase WcaI
MRVLLVNRFFGDSQAPTGRMLFDVATQLKARGHDVFVVTSNGQYVTGGPTSPALARDSFNVLVINQWTAMPRLVNWIWFWIGAVVRVPLLRWDRCVFLTDPPFLAVAAWLPKVLYGNSRKTYLWAMDIYPDALAAAGLTSDTSIFYRLLRTLADLALRAVDGVIALGPRQLQRLKAYRHWPDQSHFSMIVPPWDERPIDRISREANPVVKKFGWERVKVALYAGNLGEGHSHEEFVAAARALIATQRTDWLFAFFVRGSGVGRLKELAKKLPNVQVSDYLPDAETAPLLWSATVHLISMKPGWEGVIVPSKLYGILKTDAPVLFVGPEDADTGLEVERLGRGRQIRPGSQGPEIVDALDALYDFGPKPLPAAKGEKGAERVADFVCA